MNIQTINLSPATRREERISLELVSKLSVHFSGTEKGRDSIGSETASSKNVVRQEAEPANQFERCSRDGRPRHCLDLFAMV